MNPAPLAVGGLIRDRVPELAVYLRHLRTIRWPDIRWVFVLDNCGPEAKRLVERLFPEAKVTRVSDGARPYYRDGVRSYAHLAILRNRLAHDALDCGAIGLLSIDSDIVAAPELAEQVLATSRPWVAALVDNSKGQRAAFNILWKDRNTKGFTRHRIERLNGGPADLIGAACFYRKDLMEQVSFEEREIQEDTGFALAAATAGFSGWYVPLELEHLMTEAQTTAHLNRCELCGAAG